MVPSRLHSFDQQLCWHVAYNTKKIFVTRNKPNARLLDQSLAAFVDDVAGQKEWLHGPNMLLTEYDMRLLEWVIGLHYRNHCWISLPQIIELWHDCTAEIISELTRDLVMPWWDFCRAKEEQLVGASLCYQDGVALIAHWTQTIRYHLRMMGKRHLVPAPEGSFPSPRCRVGRTKCAADERSIKGKALPPAAFERNGAQTLREVDLEQVSTGIASLAKDVHRIADALEPPNPSKVDTPYVANRLDCTTAWVAEMARNGDIPASCVVAGTGDGKPWKFYSDKIEEWIAAR